MPGEDIGLGGNAGTVQLFSSNDIDTSPRAGLTQDTAGVSDATESGDLFGDRVAFGRSGTGRHGRPGWRSARRRRTARPTDTGLVQVFPITDLDAESTYTQDSAGVPGGAEAGDRFGSTLAFVNGCAERALIVGVPDESDNSTGMVNVIPLGGGAPRSWAPGAGGVPAGASRFGDALASVAGST